MRAMPSELETVRRRSWFTILFGVFAVLLALAVFAGLVAWLVIPEKSVATAIFRVARARPSIVADNFAELYDKQEYEVFKKSQLAMLRSYFVLESALRKPGISSLSTFAGKEDPKEWLVENLEVEYPEDGEYLAISLKGWASQMEDLTQIVDAVGQAYMDEMVYKERARRLSTKDLLRRRLDDIESKIRDKSSEMLAIARDSGRHDEATSAALRQLNLDRLGRIESEILRLENEHLELEGGGDEASSKSYEARIARLRERQAELENLLVQGSELSMELNAMKAELDVLQQTANELAIKLQVFEIDQDAPQRIELVQPATIETD
jgi:hypothetical protein